MSDYLANLRAVATEGAAERADPAVWEAYGSPGSGAFVGEHTGFVVVVDPPVFLALLDVAQAAEALPDAYIDEATDEVYALRQALARLRTLTGEDQT